MFIRFVVLMHDEDSRIEQGVFQAAAWLKGQGVLTRREEDWLEEVLRWFNRELAVPRRLSRSRRRYARAKAVCWFKPTAGEHILRIRDIVAILEDRGVATKMLVTRRPGYVVYEDEHQVAAIAFSDRRRQ